MRLILLIAAGALVLADAARRLLGYGYPENRWIGWLQLAAVALGVTAIVVACALTRTRWTR